MNRVVYSELRKIAAGPAAPHMYLRDTEDKLKDTRDAAAVPLLGTSVDGKSLPGFDWSHAHQYNSTKGDFEKLYPAGEQDRSMGLTFNLEKATQDKRFPDFWAGTQRLAVALDSNKPEHKAYIAAQDDYDNYLREQAYNKHLNDVATENAKRRYKPGSGEPLVAVPQDTFNADWDRKYRVTTALRAARGLDPYLKAYRDDYSQLIPEMRSAQWLNENRDNHDLIASDEGASHLKNVYNMTSRPALMGAINNTQNQIPQQLVSAMGLPAKQNDQTQQAYQQQLRERLNSNLNKARWAYENHAQLRDLNEMRKSPFMYLLSALFSRDPSKLYNTVGSLNRMFDNRIDPYWDAMGNEKYMKGYAGYMPFLRMLYNIRGSLFGGDDFKYLSEE